MEHRGVTRRSPVTFGVGSSALIGGALTVCRESDSPEGSRILPKTRLVVSLPVEELTTECLPTGHVGIAFNPGSPDGLEPAFCRLGLNFLEKEGIVLRTDLGSVNQAEVHMSQNEMHTFSSQANC